MGCCCSREGVDPKKTGKGNQQPRGAGPTANTRDGSVMTDLSSQQRSSMESERDVNMALAGTKRKMKVKYVALWDYTKSSGAELSFKRGDIFKELGDECDAGPEWMFVTHERSGTGVMGTGYVPRNYVAQIGTINAEPSYFGPISRREAEAFVKGRPDGTFLIRRRAAIGEDDDDAPYALAVSFHGRVKHFKIHTPFYGKSNFHLCGKKFNSISDLIVWFRHTTDGGMCCLLTESPARPPPQRSILSADVEKHWQEIPRTQIKIEREIGKGFFGVVYRGTWQPTEKVKLEVAVKEFKKGAMGTREEFLAEAVAMKSLMHENLLKLHGIVSADEPFWIITEFVRNGSLQTYLKQRVKEKRRLSEAQLVEIARQIACGMEYLEKREIIHRDLAARNILIQEDVEHKGSGKEAQKDGHSEVFDVKIADFGLAKITKSGRPMKETRPINVATKWTAPEALTHSRFSSASDVWSYGVLLHELFTHGGEPYAGLTTDQTRKMVVEEHKHLERSPEIPEKIYTLMCQCFEMNEAARPTFKRIHQFLIRYHDRIDETTPYEMYRQGRD